MTVITSGYYDPLHIGHVRYLKAACKLGDYHVAIVNSDSQAVLKKQRVFMDQEERREIVASLACVDIAVLAMDADMTVCKTIERIVESWTWAANGFIFAKGGDRIRTNTPESRICKKLGVKVVYGVGGSKVQSSSRLLERVHG